MVVVAILLLLGIIMHTFMIRLGHMLLVIITVVLTTFILVDQDILILTGMTAIILGIDLLEVSF